MTCETCGHELHSDGTVAVWRCDACETFEWTHDRAFSDSGALADKIAKELWTLGLIEATSGVISAVRMAVGNVLARER